MDATTVISALGSVTLSSTTPLTFLFIKHETVPADEQRGKKAAPPASVAVPSPASSARSHHKLPELHNHKNAGKGKR